MVLVTDLTERELQAQIDHLYKAIDSLRQSGFLNRRELLAEWQIELDLLIQARNRFHGAE